jgi:hypothetical protein
MENSVLTEPFCEVSVHNTHPPFSLKSVLISFGDHLAEALHISALTTTKPKIDEWLSGIVIGHRGIDTFKIDFIKYKIPCVAKVFLGDITPEIQGIFTMPFEVVVADETCSQIIPEA